MKKFVLAGALLLVTMASAQAAEYRNGDWVLARYQGAQYWFPGTVEQSRGDSVSVAYDDGERETLSSRDVKPYDWRVGSSVECQWKGGAEWYSGRITEMGKDGESISVAYEDGDRERTRTRKCRSR